MRIPPPHNKTWGYGNMKELKIRDQYNHVVLTVGLSQNGQTMDVDLVDQNGVGFYMALNEIQARDLLYGIEELYAQMGGDEY